MTNEKDREEAYRLAAKIGALSPLSCSDPGCLACFEHRKDAVDLLLNYRSDAVKAELERFLTANCAEEAYEVWRLYEEGKQEESAKEIAGIKKAELEKCAEKLRKHLEAIGIEEGDEIGLMCAAILSNDQEAKRG